MKQLEVVAGIIVYNNQILCVQRGQTKYEYTAYKFEFPGGKIEKGETHVEALQRELIEELDLKVEVNEQNYFMSVEHTYPDFKLKMHCYWCKAKTPEFHLKEHIHYEWLNKDDLDTLDWVEADWVIIKTIKRLNNLTI